MQDGGGKGHGREAEPLILIVDDYQDLAEPLSRLLRRIGYATDVAHGGTEAIHYLQEHRPALVILDLLMPDIGGLQVLRWLRASPNGDLPVIVYTSTSDDSLLRESINAGANEFWLKGTLDFFQIAARVAGYVSPPKMN